MADIQGFLGEHPDWGERLGTHKLWLGIPGGVLDRLGELKRNTPRWLAQDGAWQAEMDFLDFIGEPNGGGAIGVRQGAVVNYPPYQCAQSYSALLTDEVFEAMGWQQHIASAQVARDQLDKAQKETIPMIQQRLLGYAGWLVTNPIYVREASLLEEAWCTLPAPMPFPSDITMFRAPEDTLSEFVNERMGSQCLDGGEAVPTFEFVGRMANFYKRWGILQLPDWNFPVPQGPLFGEKDVLKFVRNNDLTGQVVYVPGWYEVIASRDNVLDTLKSNQRRVKDDRFIDGDGWPISHHARYVGIFLCLHALQAIEQRSGKLDEKSREFELVLELITGWLDEKLPEPRGGANKGQGEGGGEDTDKAARVRRLLKFSKQRLSGKIPKDLMPKKRK